jgi:hypothetical protein
MRLQRKRRPVLRAPELSIAQILAWADAHHERTGKWPKKESSGRIAGSLGEKWLNVDMALRKGLRGLPSGSSLARLLNEGRGVRNQSALPRLSRKQIIAWADAHHQRTGGWPNRSSGPVQDSPGETWTAIALALVQGHRGFRGGSSLARLLAEERSVRNLANLSPLRVDQTLAWADAHFRRSGHWPKSHSGPIPGSGGETWLAVQSALNLGQRGLPGGSSLARLLAQRRGARNHKQLPHLTKKQILAWADAHYRRTRQWPKSHSGPIAGTAGETWQGVQDALHRGQRGQPGGSSLARLLAQHRRVRNHLALPKLNVDRILTWADRHYRRTGQWPAKGTGSIKGTRGETWSGVNTALARGLRGLRIRSSLARLLDTHRRRGRAGLH